MKAILISGTHSGVGKTSLSVGIMLALRAQGLVVQPFKVGPDFLDPMWHQAATGRPSINLDSWMMTQHQVLETFHRHAATADIAVVEGVMGLFDSSDGSTEDGSTAQIAKWLGAPVLLVVDCWCLARSAAAMVKGYAEFDPDLLVQGLLLNKVGSTAHGTWLKQALASAFDQGHLINEVQVIGCLPKDEAISVPERHLGLTMPLEQQQQHHELWQAKLCELIQQHVDVDMLIALASTAVVPPLPSPAAVRLNDGCSPHYSMSDLPAATSMLVAAAAAAAAAVPSKVESEPDVSPTPGTGLHSPHAGRLLSDSATSGNSSHTGKCTIAVACDEAFCFYYHDNLTLLQAAGANLVFFSPLRDQQLPTGACGVYLGGGYPERHVDQLGKNSQLMQQLREFAAAQGPVYAECGGLLYLSQGFWKDGQSSEAGGVSNGKDSSSAGSSRDKHIEHQTEQQQQMCRTVIPLVGVLPFATRMGSMKMGYVEVKVLPGNPLFPAGRSVRGQMYHFSELVDADMSQPASGGKTSSAGESEPATKGVRAESATASTGDSDCSKSSPVGTGRCCSTPSCASWCGCSKLRPVTRTYQLKQVLPGAVPVLEGYSVGNVLASYVHLHWGGCPDLAAAFVAKCRQCQATSSSRRVSDDMGASEASPPAASGHASCSTATDADAVQAVAGGSCSSCCSGHLGSNIGSSNSSSIVSLLPSGTEILFALGLGQRVVGVSSFCDFPLEALEKAVVVRSLIDVGSMTSDEIEAAMQGFKAAGQSPFVIDKQLLQQERPGLLLTQDACGTCDADCSLACKALQEAGLTAQSTQVLVLHPKTLREVFDSITAIGAAAGVLAEAQQLAQQMQHRLDAVAAALQEVCPAAAAVAKKCTAALPALADIAGSPAPAGKVMPSTAVSDHTCKEWLGASSSQLLQQEEQDRPDRQPEQQPGGLGAPGAAVPRVLSLEGLNPLVLGGQWLPDVKLAAGCLDASGQEAGAQPQRVTWNQVLEFAPDVLLLCPCSRSPTAAMPDVQALTQVPGFLDLSAVKAGKVFVVDHSLFSRPSPRLLEGIELLAHIAHGVDVGQGRKLFESEVCQAYVA